MHKIFILAAFAAICVAANAVNIPEPKVGEVQAEEFHALGGPEKLEGEQLKEAEAELTKSLTKLAAGEEGPHYSLGKIHSASRTVVAGLRYDINADLVDKEGKTKNCDVKIWSKPVNEGSEVTFKCNEEPELLRHHDA
ncbi:sarcocystatin-A [Stomoxys calcitrans]|uniref:sarcocystatin-A n=1 Tax=Stomoxys calcitrans TaxID=35570 RepID=UPI0027E3849B|nr:sarcocystatin-A [Stomoxys calcitrans]